VLGPATVAFAFIAIGLLGAADASDWLFPEPVHYFGLMLAVVGVGLVTGAVAGRARWLIAIGLLLTPVVLLAAVVAPFDLSSFEAGDREFTPAADDLKREYKLTAGSLTVDLRDIELGSQQEIEIDFEVIAGELIIIVPVEAGVSVDANVSFGELNLFGEVRDGVGVNAEATFAGEGTFIIEARTVFGTVDVIRR